MGSSGGNGSSLGADIFIQSGGGLTLQINNTLTIPNPVEGGGPSSLMNSLLKSGGGTAYLNGVNTYLGNTLIQEGTLNLNGSVAGSISIEPSGTLSGNATVNGNLYNGGTLLPGNSIGTIYTTDLYLYPTSLYNLEVNSLGASDACIASGFAQVGGGILVTPDDLNFTAPLTYTILNSPGGITGTFSALTSTVPALMSLIYNPSTTQLTYLPLGSLALSGNALTSANSFTTLPPLPGSDPATVNSALLALSFEGMQTAFGQMGPAQFSGLTQVQLLDAILVRSTYTHHLQALDLNECPICRPLTLWVSGIGQWQNQKESDTPFGYSDTTACATLGLDYRTCHWVVGSAFSYTYDNFHWKNSAGNATINSYYGSVYSRWNYNRFYIQTAFLGSQNNYKTRRHLNFGTLNRYAHSKHTGNEWLTNCGFGYQVHAYNFSWTPYIHLDYVHLHERTYTESGAQSLDLHVHRKNATLFQGDAGVQLSKTYSAGKGVVVPTLTLAYINQTPCSSKNYHANFVNSTSSFRGTGINYERNLFAPGLALTYQRACGRVDALIHYDAEIGSCYWAQDVGLSLILRF